MLSSGRWQDRCAFICHASMVYIIYLQEYFVIKHYWMFILSLSKTLLKDNGSLPLSLDRWTVQPEKQLFVAAIILYIMVKPFFFFSDKPLRFNETQWERWQH